ncbi:MAG: bifunctional DNA-formamidopyrimidine glycosylase/DNA-(apurinic or apyrimidinic site) lyase [Gammaproteobacteria bacterium]
MPELPEVETTRRGISPHVEGQRVQSVLVRNAKLRWPIPPALAAELPGLTIDSIERRAKYLLMHTSAGTLLAHLGMSGSLRIVDASAPVRKHDHVDIVLAGGAVLRFHDPRRFGCMLWVREAVDEHPLLAGLGPEPLSNELTGDYLFARSRKRSAPVKSFIMDQRIVVGVGNIYANEALFAAGISPRRKSGSVTRAQYEALVAEIKAVLNRAIKSGGTTLRDFVGSDGTPGYFVQELQVYGRGGEPCTRCRSKLREFRQGQRASVYCPKCQR